MEDLKQAIADQVTEILETEVNASDIERPDSEFGDLAFPAMKVTAQTGLEMEDVEKRVRNNIDIPGLEKVEIEGPGFLNFYFDREELILDYIGSSSDFDGSNEKIIVEHTSPNPNKPLHMGTMRCAVLGDSIARLGEKLGYEVEVQDYINDLGRQSARTVYAYRNFMDSLSKQDKKEKDDFWIGKLYSEAGTYLEDNPEEEEKVQQVIREIEEGSNETAELKDEIVEKSLRGQLETAYRTNVFYDLIEFERDTVNAGLLENALEKLKTLESVYEVEDGEDKGCLVIDLSDYEEMEEKMQKPYKILFRSDGTATYTAKDIALTMWKFGILESGFKYKEFDDQPNGQKLYSTGGSKEMEFGDADQVINVIGAPQAFPMQVIEYSMRALGFEEEADNFNHCDFKFVYLPGKVSYSGRKGNWVGKHGDAVLDKCKELAREEIDERHDDLSEQEKDEIAEKVGVAAVRYFLLKFSRQKDIDFSFERALDWKGNSGPYLLYSLARAHGIIDEVSADPKFTTYEKDETYELAKTISEFEDVVEDAFDDQDPAKIAHYTRKLAEDFNSFYHECPVSTAGSEELKKSRAAVTESFVETMEECLELLGIEPLEKM